MYNKVKENQEKDKNQIKTGQKQEACRSQEKFKAVAVERGRKSKENKKRMVENAYTCTQTRSSSRLVSNPFSNPTLSTNSNSKGRNRRRSKQRIEEFNLEELSPPIVTMVDQRTMAQLLQAPIEGYEDAIVIPRFDEFFSEAWDRFKDLLRAYPHHGFSELHQLDTFYNALNSKDQDSLIFVAGGNFLDKMPRECLAVIESKSKVRYLRNKPVVAKVSMNTSTSGILPDVAELKDMVKALLLDKKRQNQAPATVKAVEESYVTSGVTTPRPNQRPSIPYPSRLQDQKLRDKANDQRENFFQIFKDLNSNISFADAFILMPKKVECLALADLGVSINLMQLSVWNKLFLPDLSPTCMTLELADRSISRLVGFAEDVYVKVGTFHFPADFIVVDFDADPRVPLILERSFLKSGRALINVFEAELTLRAGKEAIAFNLDQTSRYSANYNVMMAKCINVIDMACEEYSQEVLGNYLPEVRKELKICEAKSDKSSIDEPLEVKLKDLPPHLKYAFLEGDDKLPVIIAKDLSMEEKTALITVLKSHKRAIVWKLSDIKGIDAEFCTHKILMEEDFKPTVEHQRRVNPKIHDVIKQEVLKLLDAGLIYPISDSPWVSPVYYVPKKGGFTVVEIEENELILNRMEKSHFMVKEGIVLGYKISKKGIEVDKAKVDVITKLPHPTTFKGIRSFLGHAGFYRRFIKGFSKIARPMTCLLKKDTPFHFSKECVEAFQTFKRKLTKALILIAHEWDMPFELMCDASNFGIGAVLGQRQDKHFRPIHYASKTMTEAESTYTIMEKKM
nr:hypothetical protein [Tanacetum cinerariifolium]